jgi:NAD(P)H-hydrate epimerase
VIRLCLGTSGRVLQNSFPICSSDAQRGRCDMRSLTRAEVREVDRAAIEDLGVPGVVLMENAGAGTARLLESLGVTGEVVIACGKGNNGGDGFVIARHLDIAGHAVRILLACRPEEVRWDAAINLAIAQRSGLAISCLAEAEPPRWEQELAAASWIVDALLGTGASGPPAEPIAVAIAAINAARSRGSRVLAVDLPSGLDCDTGRSPGACVTAEVTATFVARKRGFDTPGSEAFTGEVRVIGIGAPRAAVVPLR